MKFVTFQNETKRAALGLWHDGRVYDLQAVAHGLPDTMISLLDGGPELMEHVKEVVENAFTRPAVIKAETSWELMAPLPEPRSFRDAYAFRQHVETSRLNRGLPMIPEFDDFPVFYFSNHRSIQGPGDVLCMPSHFQELDFELEVAVLIHKKGRNIPAERADEYIAGYMILNDFSARKLQRDEMKLNLGPAKGKDFASATGPWLVTPDELEPFRTSAPAGHVGNAFQLGMQCRVNGHLVSSGDFSSMHWTFAEIIERVSYGVDLFPGDMIGSGTVGTGCFLEINGTRSRENPGNYQPQWLRPGDYIQMEISGLGQLDNRVVLEEKGHHL